MKIERGGIYLADLNPRHGTEPGKRRPVLVVQTDLLNPHHASTVVCPLTTRVRPGIVQLRVHLPRGIAGLENDSDVLIDQIRAVDNRRLIQKMGDVPGATLSAVAERLKVVLDL